MELIYSNKSKEYTIEPGCPWYEAQQTYGPANVNWCEPTSCSLINEPANAWSNLSYILFGLYMLKKIQEQSAFLRDYAWAIVAVGIASFVYHSTNNFFSQFLDFLGMFAMSSMMLALGTKRIGNTIEGYRSWFWFYMFLNTIIFWFFYLENIAIQKTFMLNIISMVGVELYCLYREKFFKKSIHLLFAFLSIGFAQIFSIMDLKRIWCEPENLFLHGHAIWHLFGGVCTFFLFLHFQRVIRNYESKL